MSKYDVTKYVRHSYTNLIAMDEDYGHSSSRVWEF